MATQYRCKNLARQAAVRNTRAADNSPLRNGIDFLEVASDDQKTLQVTFIHDLPPAPTLAPTNVVIEGGVRIRDIRVQAVTQAGKVVTVTVDKAGDFSTYTLRIVTTQANPLTGFHPQFDSQLSEVEFTFKADCPSEFDCAPAPVCPPETTPAPTIDYLAKDYSSFRRLMLDRLAVIMPDWRERNPSDLGIALVEVMAYVGDHLSYYQDSIATEAYLGTARQRPSVHRHARLLDYPMHDGANARAWVHIQVSANHVALPKGAPLLTQVAAPRGALRLDDAGLNTALSGGALVFETLADAVLSSAFNEMLFYTWGDDACCLPRGATRATLRDAGGVLAELKAGDVLLFEEVRSPTTGLKADADPTHRHVVRLTRAEHGTDDLFPENAANPLDPQRLRVVDIEWDVADALPFPLCLWRVKAPNAPGPKQPVTVARGNMVLADHGRTVQDPELPAPIDGEDYRPALKSGPVTQQGRARNRRGRLVRAQATGQALPFDPAAPASAALVWEMRDVLPDALLTESGTDDVWLPERDLLNSGRFARDFVVDVGNDGSATLRFGDGILGAPPARGLLPTYRVGNGSVGNVGAEAIAHALTRESAITDVRNPLPAVGGSDPEALEGVRLYAPQAFRVQERAVTADDYAQVAERHPEIQKAAATLRWTGSWYTVFVTVDRLGGRTIDATFADDLRAFIDSFRLAGHDLEIDGPTPVPLDIALDVCAAPGYFRSDVKLALLETLSSVDLPDGRRGFFHPDNFTFGQPVYLSRIIAAAMSVPGVAWVQPTRFQRWGHAANNEIANGLLTTGRLEIARLDNDPNRPENGKLELDMQGGL